MQLFTICEYINNIFFVGRGKWEAGAVTKRYPNSYNAFISYSFFVNDIMSNVSNVGPALVFLIYANCGPFNIIVA